MNAFGDEDAVLGEPPQLTDDTWSRLLAHAVDPAAQPDLSLIPDADDADPVGDGEPVDDTPFTDPDWADPYGDAGDTAAWHDAHDLSDGAHGGAHHDADDAGNGLD